MYTEEQVGHAICQDAWPEAVRLVAKEVIDSTSHHPREPESMFAAEEHHRGRKGDAGKRPETDGVNLVVTPGSLSGNSVITKRIAKDR